MHLTTLLKGLFEHLFLCFLLHLCSFCVASITGKKRRKRMVAHFMISIFSSLPFGTITPITTANTVETMNLVKSWKIPMKLFYAGRKKNVCEAFSNIEGHTTYSNLYPWQQLPVQWCCDSGGASPLSL